MSTLRMALVAGGLGAMVVGGSATASALGGSHPGTRPHQDDLPSFGFSVSPGSVQPGGAVVLTVTGCMDDEATAESAIFDEVALGTPGEIQSAESTVDADSMVGTQYEVLFTCGDETGSAVLSVVDATAAPTATATATSTTTATATTTTTAAKPTLGAQAGVGGSQSGGTSGTPLLLAGAGLTALAVTGGVLALRRRPGRHL